MNRLREAWRVITGKTPPHPAFVPRIILRPGERAMLRDRQGWLMVERVEDAG
jgi:hypothetical protein